MTASSLLTVADLVPRHASRRFDLGIEPWLPVRDLQGAVVRVGLRDALANAHDYAGLAVSCPLERSSALRYLIALTYLLEAYARVHVPEWDPRDSVRNGQPFPHAAVNAVCERMADHWWLFHPDTPFMQNPAQREKAANRVSSRDEAVGDPWQSLSPSIPSKQNEAWWGKPGESASTVEPDRAALLLLVRHYCALPGNESFVMHPDGASKACKGSLGVSLGAPTAFFQLTSTLAGTLLSNLTHGLRGQVQWESRCFWEALDEQVPRNGGALYLYTFSAAGSLLLDSEPDGTVARVLRGSQPFAPDVAKDAITAARLADPHMLRSEKVPGALVKTVTDTHNVVLDADGSQFADAYTFFAKAVNASRLRDNVLDRASRPYPALRSRVFVVPIVLAGNASGPRIQTVADRTIDPCLLEVDEGRAAALGTLLGRLAGKTSSIQERLTTQVHDAVAGPAGNGSDRLKSTTRNRVQAGLWDRFDALLRTKTDAVLALTDAQVAEVGSEYLAAVSLSEDERRAWVESALETYDELTFPYEASAHSRRRIVKNRVILKGELWMLLSPS